VVEEERRRFLDSKDSKDDEIEEEQWGYNCVGEYSGATNCNLCKTFLASAGDDNDAWELASAADLERASSQGTIVEITVDSQTYGSGGIRPPPGPLQQILLFSFAVGVGMMVGYLGFLVYLNLKRRHPVRYRRKQGPNSLRERLHIGKLEDANTWKSDESNNGRCIVDASSAGPKTLHFDETLIRSDEESTGGCAATEDRLADLWVLFSPDTEIDESPTMSGSLESEYSEDDIREKQSSISSFSSHQDEGIEIADKDDLRERQSSKWPFSTYDDEGIEIADEELSEDIVVEP
jgi:hypothetical protein